MCVYGRVQAVCHPNRKATTLRELLCKPCYDEARRRRAKCHPELREAANGLCRKCYNDLPENKARAISVRRLKKYGIKEEVFDNFMTKQNGVCAICGRKPDSVDHNHSTGKVRGILCRSCNTGLGHFRDSEELLIKAAGYLNGAK